MKHVKRLAEIGIGDISQFGGKNASLGEMITHLAKADIKVPKGFATTAEAYFEFLQHNRLSDKITKTLAALKVEDVKALRRAGAQIRRWILAAELPKALQQEITTAYQQLHLKAGQSVAVRSSATAEDLPEASFAGQQETYLNVKGAVAVLAAVKRVYASLFTDRAITYRVQHGFEHMKVGISAGVQQMIRSDKAASGVMFTLDTESGFDQVVFITAAYGLGETVVQGEVNMDEFYVHKPTLAKGKRSIISRELGSKKIKMIFAGQAKQQAAVKTVPVAKAQQAVFCLQDDEILSLARQAVLIERHYGKPMDIEWAKDGVDGRLYIIQARPETVKSQQARHIVQQYHLNGKGTVLTSGRSVGQKIAAGKARLIATTKDMDKLQAGEVLVTDMTDPDWEPIMKRAAAIVTNRGGRTCHAAIVARELGIPAVVGCGDATETVRSGQMVTVSCAGGETGYIYQGQLDFTVEETEIAQLPKLPVKLCINIADPDKAFSYQFLPNHGVGLARLEFIISNLVGMHPNAALKYAELSKSLQQQVRRHTQAYRSPQEFYIEKLAEGMATIGAAFYPKPVIVRFSDFKSNEYANLLGGKQFEPVEDNPMIGYRGGSRYVSGNFKDCFALECQAVKRVREDKGLDNVHVMFPFVRTLPELKQLLALLKANGLQRGKAGLSVYLMCEIPSNALLADQFLQHVDGFSIGSNDLTQLTLGLDRDSELVAATFDERNEAVKTLLHIAISRCNALKKYVGICGQGPSDHLDFAKWLMAEGIQSMSLSPDSIVKTWLALGKVK